jgi:hypothetical protein
VLGLSAAPNSSGAFLSSHNLYLDRTVAWTGEKKTLGPISEHLMAELPVEDVIGSNVPRSGHWGSCAVVGNSGLLKK